MTVNLSPVLKKKKNRIGSPPAVQDAKRKGGWREEVLGPCCDKKTGGQEGVPSPDWEKAQEFWHWTIHPAQKGPHSLLCQIALLHLAAATKGYLLSKLLKVPLAIRFTQALDTEQLLNSWSWLTNTDQRQRKRTEIVDPGREEAAV